MESFTSIPLAIIIDDDEIHIFTIGVLIQNHHFAEQIINFSDGKDALDFFSVGPHYNCVDEELLYMKKARQNTRP